jgi:hypothetical protein
MRTSLVVLCVAAVVAADTLPADHGALLDSNSTLDQAWGAYLAGERCDGAAIPALRRLLAARLADESRHDRVVRRTVLDALIRLEADVPWEELEVLPRSHGTEVLVLLARRPRANRAALLELFDRPLSQRQWLAVGNLLAAQRAPGFAARLLERLETVLRITVVEPEQCSVGGGSRRILGGSGDAVLRVEEGWPPVARYFLLERCRPGARPLAPGRRPIWVIRVEAKQGPRGFGDQHRRYDRHVLRLEYLAQLLGREPDRAGLERETSTRIVWEDPRDFVREALTARGDIVARHRRVVRELLNGGLLTAEEASALEPRIVLRVEDRRELKVPALPSLPRG